MNGLPSSLDALAANGIVDFDSEAFVYGMKPRYVGSPYEVNLPFEAPLPAYPRQLPMGTYPITQAKNDMFINPQKTDGKSPSAWKKALAWGLAVAGAVVLGVKFKAKIKPTAKKLASLIAAPFKAIKNKFSKTAKAGNATVASSTASTGATAATPTAATSAATSAAGTTAAGTTAASAGAGAPVVVQTP